MNIRGKNVDDFRRGGDQEMKLPLARPSLGSDEEAAVRQVLQSKSIASGQVVKELEMALAHKFGRAHCVVVNSGTCALYISLRALRTKQVVIPTLTCPDVLHAVLNAGARPVFADIDPETHNVDLTSLSEKQWDGCDGIIVTQAYGHSADMDMVRNYARKFQASVIEDFAQATGGYFNGRILGSFGRVSITSFYATKNMTTGHGGAILTDDPEVYRKCLNARGDSPYDFYSGIIPLNLKMTDIQAAIGLVQLSKLDQMVNLRRNIASRMTSLLRGSATRPPVEKTGVRHAYYKYHILLPEYMPKGRFIEGMSQEGVSVGRLYDPPLHQTPLARNLCHTQVSLPVSEDIAPRTVSLPIFPEMTEEECYHVHRAIGKVMENG